jgi:type VI secretion system protein ImpL
MELLARLSKNLPLVLLVLGLVLLFLVVLLYLLVRSRRAEKDAGAPPEGGAGPAGAVGDSGAGDKDLVAVDFTGRDAAAGLVSSFHRGLRLLKRHVSGVGYRAQIPWFLLVGEEAAGKRALLAGSGLDLPFGAPEAGQGCAWWLFDRGVVLDIAPEYVLDATGRGSDDARWQLLLRLLQRHRPERPIDGIVLALSGPDLARPGERPAERTARAERKATILAAKLRLAQTRLGMRLPIYLLVSGCEKLPGFHAFFDELPDRLKDEMFGWSSPYGVETAYRSDWVDEAAAAVRRDLLAAQLEVFAERREAGGDAEQVFTFPDELDAWKEPLRIYADRLFRASAYHESIFPRGIYYAALAEGGVETAGRSLFVRDLFERKVFPEHSLGRPTARTFQSQGRAVRALQVGVAVAVLVLGIGVWNAYRKVAAGDRSLHAFFDRTLYNLNELRAIKLDKRKPTPKLLERQTFELFADMAGTRTDRLRSAFLPASWFSPLDRDVQRAIGSAYDHIIYRAFKYGLADRVEGLATWRPEATVAGEAPLPLESNARFRELRDYAAKAIELEKNRDIYNSLKQTQRLEDLGTLVKYLYDRSLPQSFFDSSDLYREALSFVQVQPFVFFDANRERGRMVVRDLSTRLDESLYQDNSQRQSLKELTDAFNEVGQRGEMDESEQMSRLLGRIQAVESEAGRSDLAPLSAPTFNLGGAYDQVLTQIGASAFLGEPVAAEVRSAGRSAHQAYREELATYGWVPYLAPYLVRKETGLTLSPDLKLLEQALADFLRQSAPPEGSGAELDARLPAGRRLLWDVPLLDQAVALYAPYKAFSEHGLAAFPARLREPLRSVAAQRVAASVTDLVGRAERLSPSPEASGAPLEEDLRAQVEAWNAAAKPVADLRDVYRQLGLSRNDQALATLSALQGFAILRGLDRLLAQEHLYVPRQESFAFWDGTKPLAARAFVAGDPAELPVYLDKQRERIAYLAGEYAAPVLKTVPRADARREQDFLRLYDGWNAIALALKDYDAKKAGNALAGLEGLVLQDLEEVELGSCAKKAALRSTASVGGGGTDYFSCTAARLRKDLYRRCSDLALDGYGRIEQLFDARLAGRFPFSETLPGRTDAEADPEAIRAFFALFDRYAPMLLAGLSQGGQGGQGSEPGGGRVREFILGMENVRAFFAPFLDGDGRTRPPAYDVAVDFRVDRGERGGPDNELDGNQVIRWQLEVGDRRATLQDPEPARHLRWTLGQPVALTLGWAKDSPFVPVDAGGQELPDKSAVFAYANLWSLLALTRANALSTGEPGSAAARTLELAVPTRNPATGAKRSTRVFLRLTFRPAKAEGAPDKEKEMPQDLLVPRFPTRAPRIDPASLSLVAGLSGASGLGSLTGAREEALCAP